MKNAKLDKADIFISPMYCGISDLIHKGLTQAVSYGRTSTQQNRHSIPKKNHIAQLEKIFETDIQLKEIKVII